MKKYTSQPFNDAELAIPNRTLGLLLISLLGLFLELLFIRWIGTEIRIFAYLQNTVLVACFLGLGLGMFTSSKPVAIRNALISMALLLLLMAIPASRSALGRISDMLSVLGDLVIWGPTVLDDPKLTILFVVTGLALTFITLSLIVDIFVSIGRLLGRLMNAHPHPVWAYSVNIVGSILGTWMFVVLSSFYQPPFTWFLLFVGMTCIVVLWLKKDRRINFALLGTIMILGWFTGLTPNAMQVIWSPYQKLVVRPAKASEAGLYIIDVNNIGYQGILDLSAENIAANPDRYPASQRGFSQYDIPFLLHPNPTTVLLVGAGSGNDAAGALRNELVQNVTAVEIDPAIIMIGKNLHPEEPYSSPKVRVVNDDARSFFATTGEKYDVISFGLLDSHTTTAMTNARLDHYVYTKESILQAKSRLAQGGIMVLTFESQKPYIADRIDQVLREVFNQPPLFFVIPGNSYGWGGAMFVTGDLEQVQNQLDQNPQLAEIIAYLQKTYPVELAHQTKPAVDDWPYIYLESPRIPILYYLLIGVMAILLFRSSRKWQASFNVTLTHRSFWHFFFLGSAFLLLEVQNISKASVVLGNTWQVNAVIISSVLGMALLANWIVHRFPKLPTLPVYILLIAVSLSLYFVDLARFGFLPYTSKAMIVGFLTSLPMLFSGIIFTRSFSMVEDRSNALGANLIGALAGALLQSITFITGIKALLLVVAGFYLLSLLSAPVPATAVRSIVEVPTE